jgi:hypothetical protein
MGGESKDGSTLSSTSAIDGDVEEGQLYVLAEGK